MISILTIERHILNTNVKTFYFVRDAPPEVEGVNIIGYLHSFVPMPSLRCYETNQIDLLQTEEELLMATNSSTRRQIRRAMELDFEFAVLENPTDADLNQFRTFYNQFARNKKTDLCNAYHMETMKLLREKDALVITYLQAKDGSTLGYRVYIMDGFLTNNIYSASHFRLMDDHHSKKILGRANRYLIWKSLLYFKEKGCEVYDMGGLTDDENIRRFKVGFGGEVVTVYSGYEARSLYGRFLLMIRNLKLKLTRGIL